MGNKKIKTKQNINITIDTDIYIKTRMKENLNLSGLINDFLKKYFEDEEDSEEELKNELEEAKKKQTILEYELKKIEKNKEQEKQLKLNAEEKAKQDLINSIPTGNDFYSKLQREKILEAHPELKKEFEK